jgi:hypothetical protein
LFVIDPKPGAVFHLCLAQSAQMFVSSYGFRINNGSLAQQHCGSPQVAGPEPWLEHEQAGGGYERLGIGSLDTENRFRTLAA